VNTETIKEFLVGLGFKVDEAGLGRFTSSIQTATLAAVGLGAAVAGMAAKIFHDVKETAETYDALDKLATRLRSTVDAVDEFNDIGGLLGLTNEQTEGSLKALDRAIGDTALGLGRAKKVFEEIGLEVLDAGGKMRPTTEVMEELSGLLKGMERGKAIAVMERLNLDPALLKIFNADLVGLRAELEAIDKAAGFDLGDAVAQSKAFMVSWRALQVEWRKGQLVFEKMQEAISVRLMPRIGEAIDKLRRQMETARKYIMDNMGGIQRVISAGIDIVLQVFNTFWLAFSRIMEIVGSFIKVIIDGFNALTPNVWLAAAAVAGLMAAWALLNSAFLASPIGRLVALGVALALLAEDFYTWREGGDSLIDWAKWENEIQIAIDIFNALRETLQSLFVFLFESMDSLGSIVTEMLTSLENAIGFFVNLLNGDFVGAWNNVGEVLNSIIEIFKTVFGWIGKLIDGVASFVGVSGSLTGRVAAATSGLSGNYTQAVSNVGAIGFNGQGMSPAAPTPAAQAQLGGATQNVTQKTDITVQGGGNPEATGRAVAAEQSRVNADMTRNLAPRAR
jgi:hypothetical protein